MISRICNIPKSQSFFMFGPRGSGKSTLLKSHFAQYKNETSKDVMWVNLLDQNLELQLSQRPDILLEWWKAKKQDWIVIDEVQKIPKILDVVHLGIEEYKIKFALTGSSSRKIKSGGANLLAGRALQRELAPFSSIELGKKFNLEKSLKFGMLPKLWDEKLSEIEMADFLFSYVGTYLKEEIAAEQLVRNLDPFRRFLVSAAQMNGKILNHSAIERDAGIPRKQSERHFEILIDTLLGHYLPPFNTSVRKRQSKKSKFYFFDTGVVRALQKIAGEDLESSTFEFGNLFESMIVNEFFKLTKALNKHWEFSYFQSSTTNEIDLVLEKPKGKPILIEIKSFKKLDVNKLGTYFKINKEISHQTAYVLSNDPVSREIENVRCLHWQDGIKEIFEI